MTDDEARVALAALIMDPAWKPAANWAISQGAIAGLISRGFAEWYKDDEELWQVRILPAGERFFAG